MLLGEGDGMFSDKDTKPTSTEVMSWRWGGRKVHPYITSKPVSHVRLGYRSHWQSLYSGTEIVSVIVLKTTLHESKVPVLTLGFYIQIFTTGNKTMGHDSQTDSCLVSLPVFFCGLRLLWWTQVLASIRPSMKTHLCDGLGHTQSKRR